MSASVELPNWLQQNQPVTNPSAKKHGYNPLNKNLGWLQHLLTQLNAPQNIHQTQQQPWLQVVNLAIMILLFSLAQKPLLIWLLALVWLVRLYRLSALQLYQFAKRLGHMSVFSILFILPSCFLNSWSLGLWLLFKTVLILGQVALFLQEITWVDFIKALRQLHVPPLFVLALSITIKYCHILATYLVQVLWAIELRRATTVPTPFYQTAKIMGRLYLTSKRYVLAVYEAMTLRGYQGQTTKVEHLALSKHDWRILGLDLSLIMMYCLVWRY
ncbi:MAG: energy-coupling factor transporter transmembrane protein EcfT [Lactobacillus sp.]|jgi:cobalt/nickel transport system permease protein|nr:energy-coupling factor transporter transmembrane protein EcfT [Lactobacillus sp.]